MTRLYEKYKNELVSQLQSKLKIRNIMEVPKLTKITINMGVGDAVNDKKIMDSAVRDLSLIAGQKALITKSRKSIAGFKIRDGWPIGCKVTLRREQMYEFLDKLINISLPRTRDFRGLSAKSFDGRGNYNFGLNEQLMFPEVEYDKILRTHGMNITIVTTTNSDKEAFRLLELIGMPFAKGK